MDRSPKATVTLAANDFLYNPFFFIKIKAFCISVNYVTKSPKAFLIANCLEQMEYMYKILKFVQMQMHVISFLFFNPMPFSCGFLL